MIASWATFAQVFFATSPLSHVSARIRITAVDVAVAVAVA